MRRKNHKKSIIIVLILFISIGFAALTANLSLNSNITFLPQSFNIYFDNLQVNPESSNTNLPTLSNNDQEVSFTTTINEPGDFYEFTFDVVNDGTMDAALDEIIKSGLTETQEQYLDYTARYYGEREIKVDDILHAGYKEKIVVRVEYKYNIDNVPSLGNISFTFGLDYIKRDLQKDYGEEVWSIEYTGNQRTLKIPKTGIYKLETWGAQGGSVNESYRGGYGGYSTGTIQLTKNNNYYINVGGEGNTLVVNAEQKYAQGGYNGGGPGSSCCEGRQVCGGGGATHIASSTGLLSALESNKSSILLVSGGGGGSWYLGPGASSIVPADAGGYVATSGSNGGSTNCNVSEATGGTQEYNASGLGLGMDIGTFGQGAGQGYRGSAGGGGGYYGGNSTCHASGGGSGYIGNTNLTNKIMYCYNCQSSINEADETNIKTRSTTNVSEEPISNYAKEGNGFARITYLGNYNANQYTVINYHPNGGQGSMDTQVITSNSTLKENKYKREGYTFVGWSTTEKELENIISSVNRTNFFSLNSNNNYYFDTYTSGPKDKYIIFELGRQIVNGESYTFLVNASNLDHSEEYGFPTQASNSFMIENGFNSVKFSSWTTESGGGNLGAQTATKAILDDYYTSVPNSGEFYNFFLYKDSEVNYLDKANITYSSNTRTINLYALWAKVES